jgi:Trk K+ transport system NAD-binding subunit
MQSLFFLFLLRIRIPLVLLVCCYATVILGLTLIPGIDDQGNVWYMSFFHAFYFVSFMGSTIGFGEIPYAFTDAQRLWTIVGIYLTVITWIYSIGTVLTTLQDPAFRRVLKEHRFKKNVEHICEPFYLICGYGDTGRLLAHELAESHILSVVLDIKQERVDILQIEEPNIEIPALCGDASNPRILATAGLKNTYCQGIIALTDKDEVNLHIAITARLLQKNLQVICRAETKETEVNMASFGTTHIINPFDIYAKRLALSVRSSSAYLIYEWLTNPNHELRNEPLVPPRGIWVICGYGRFGKAVSRYLEYEGIHTTIIEADPELTSAPDKTIVGRGTEAVTLREAKIQEASAIVAATDKDSNNLSIILTAQDETKKQGDESGIIKSKLFTVARQNSNRNEDVFKAASLDYIMQPASIIAGEILSIIKTPLLANFLKLARREKEGWANILISRISGFEIKDAPDTWMLEIYEEQTPAILMELNNNRRVKVGEILKDPRDRTKHLNCMVLLICRKEKDYLIPEDTMEIIEGDKLLFCGTSNSRKLLSWTVDNYNIYNYIRTGIELPGGYIWHWLNKKYYQ